MVEVYRNGELPVENSQETSSATLSPDGQYLYVTSDQDDSVVVFTRNQANGQLTYLTAYKNGEIATSNVEVI